MIERMNISGLRQLSQHVPDLNSGAGRLRLLLLSIGYFALTTAFFLLTDRLIPDWQPDGQIILMALGFLILARFFSQKKTYLERYAELAYRNAFVRFVIPGLGIIFAAILHTGYMPGIEIPDVWWKLYLTWLGGFWLVVGLWLWARTILTFGLDNLAMLYVYYPAESRMVDSSIYGILRHPVYAGALRVILGLALLNGNWPALIFALLAPLGMFGWVRLVEERELLQRFPDYREYRNRVPAFWTWKVNKLWKFLLQGI
jgi:protein-S-isoprenylcysteine O-methyltransferase Ste14